MIPMIQLQLLAVFVVVVVLRPQLLAQQMSCKYVRIINRQQKKKKIL